MVQLFRRIFKKAVFFPLLLFYLFSTAQPVKKFDSRSYGVNEGLLNGHILDLVEDANGFLWISSGLGLQRFDGSTFETIQPQQDLLQTNDIYFFKLSNGNIWIRYESGISVYNVSTNKFRLLLQFSGIKVAQQHTRSLYPSSFVVPLVEIKDYVWCRDLQKNFICINKFSGKIVDSLQLPEKMQPASYMYKKANDNTLFFEAAGNTIVQIDFTTKQVRNVFHPDPASSLLTYTPVNNTDLIITTDKGIYKANISTGDLSFLSNYPVLAIKNIRNRSLTYLNSNLFAVSLNNELFILNSQSGKIVYRMVDKQNNSFVYQGYINKCITDRYNHLWILSDTTGVLKKVDFNNLKFKYYGAGEVQKNFSTCIYADKKYNLIITGTLFNGFSVFDTSLNLIKHFTLKPWEQSNSILKIETYKYLLFTNWHPGIYLFNAKNLQLTPLDKKVLGSLINKDVDFKYVQPITDTTAALFCDSTAFIIHNASTNLTFTQLPLQKNFSSGTIDYKKQSDSYRMWLGETGKYFVLTGKNFGQEQKFYLPENVKTKCFYQDKEKNIWLGTEKGLYKLNRETGAIIHGWQKKDGLANDSIYSIIEDNKGTIWCGTNKGISGIENPDSYREKIINIYASDGLQSEGFNTNSIAKAEDGELFFGGVNGVNSFYPQNIEDLSQDPKILMSNIKVMDKEWHHDTALWNLQQITLPYTENVVSFYFATSGKYSSGEYIYQYKMTGIDKEWINSGKTGYTRYVLPPGKYVFEYAAGTEFVQTDSLGGKNVLHKKYIAITITPPFWQRAWFIILMAMLGIIIIIAIVNYYNKQQQTKKLRQLEVQQTIQQERQRISRDLHDNIGAYTTVLLASTEKLQQQSTEPAIQQSAKNVSENAHNIIGSLQETIWVLNNDAITITDFADRFKLYAKKILQPFANVQLSFEEQLDKDIELSPSEALNLYRIMQEAMQNSLKHGNPGIITVTVHSNENIHISVKDDGKGFTLRNSIHGNGLKNMKYRAKEIGYELHILSTEKGTVVTLQKK